MTESNDKTTLSGPTGSIVDATGGVWTLKSGKGLVVYLNDVAAGFSSNVKLLVYFGKVIFQQNTSGSWWNWINGTWAKAAAPAIFPVSADLTTVRPGSGTVITDTSGVQWTLTGTAQVAANGVTDASTANVNQLVFVKNAVWQQNTSGNWWCWRNAAWVTGAAPILLTASPNHTVVKLGAAITDTLGTKWALTTGGQIVKDGSVDAATAAVAQLAYVDNTIWQQTIGGLWWGMIGGVWSPPAGTAISPLAVSTNGVNNGNPRITVDLSHPLLGANAPISGDPIIATPEVFGVSMGSNWDGFASLNTDGWRNAVAAVGGFYFIASPPIAGGRRTAIRPTPRPRCRKSTTCSTPFWRCAIPGASFAEWAAASRPGAPMRLPMAG
jgi:hypothetical protein